MNLLLNHTQTLRQPVPRYRDDFNMPALHDISTVVPNPRTTPPDICDIAKCAHHLFQTQKITYNETRVFQSYAIDHLALLLLALLLNRGLPIYMKLD